MYETSEIRKGLKILLDGAPYVVVEFQFVKPGKGTAFTRTKMKNMISGSVLEKTFKTGEKLAPAAIEERKMQYLYPEGDKYCFMDQTDYDQVFLMKDLVGDNALFMPDNLVVEVLFFEGRAVGLTLPTFVELEVTETEPGFKGDTSSNTTKPATISTGGNVNVPLFVNVGDVLKIDTRDRSYVERVRK